MKFHLRYFRWSTVLTRLRRRLSPPRAAVPFLPPEERPRRRVRYIPIWMGSQVLPLLYFEEQSDQPRDIYDLD